MHRYVSRMTRGVRLELEAPRWLWKQPRLDLRPRCHLSCLEDCAVVQVLLEQLRRLHEQGQVRLGREVLVHVDQDVRLGVVAAHGGEVLHDVGSDEVDEDEVHGLGDAAVIRKPAERLEEVRVGVAWDRRVRRVVAVGAEGVRRGVALREEVRGRLPPEVARVLARVRLDVAGRERGDEGVDAGVAGQVWRRGHGGGGGGALPDRAVLVDAVCVVSAGCHRREGLDEEKLARETH